MSQEELVAVVSQEGRGTAARSQSDSGEASPMQRILRSRTSRLRGNQEICGKRNVEYHLEVSDQLGRAGSDAELESGQLVVTIECGGSGYFRIGPALDALEAEAEGLGAAFYWALTLHSIA
jgi:hypothetical protein